MIRNLAIWLSFILMALPVLARPADVRPATTPSALHLMNDTEFAAYLQNLDAGMLRWKAQLKYFDVASLNLDRPDASELERSDTQCLQALDNAREEIQKLSQRQSLKLDFLLLIDLNDLARSLDDLNRDLANPGAVRGNASARKSLGYAQTVLAIDSALASHMIRFQQHVLAYAGLADATLARDAEDSNEPPPGK